MKLEKTVEKVGLYVTMTAASIIIVEKTTKYTMLLTHTLKTYLADKKTKKLETKKEETKTRAAVA